MKDILRKMMEIALIEGLTTGSMIRNELDCSINLSVVSL